MQSIGSMKVSALLGIILLLCGCGETPPPCQKVAQSPLAPSAGVFSRHRSRYLVGAGLDGIGGVARGQCATG